MKFFAKLSLIISMCMCEHMSVHALHVFTYLFVSVRVFGANFYTSSMICEILRQWSYIQPYNPH